MENLLKGFFAIALGSLWQTSTMITLIISVMLLMVYLFFKKHNVYDTRKEVR